MSKKVVKRRIVKKTTERNFICDKCNKTFTTQRYLELHNERIPNCDEQHKCHKCQKIFSRAGLLKKHLDRVTPCAPESVPVIEVSNPDNTCKFCNNNFATKSSLTRHYTTCTVYKNPSLLAHVISKLVDTDKQNIYQQQVTVNNITNTVNNVQNNINVMIVSYGSEDLSRLDLGSIKKMIMEKAQEFIPQMIGQIHNNNDLPEYKNILYDVQNNRAVVFANKGENELTWVLKDPNIVSQELTKKIKNHVINNQELNSLFSTAADDKDWEKFAEGIHIINDMDGEALAEENMLALAEAHESNDPEVKGLITAN